MRSDMIYPQPRGVRARITEKLKAKVRLWVDGFQYTYFDSAAGVDMEWADPAYPTMRVLKTVADDGDTIKVGRYAGIHYSAVVIPGGQHHLDWVSAVNTPIEDGEWVDVPGGVYSNGQVVIGNNVFIAYQAVINSGITIGDGAVVAARAMVVKDVEPYSIVGGNPAKHIRYRFDEPTREGLLRIQWWNWPVSKVTAHKDQIHSTDVAGFVAGHDPALGEPSCPICQSAAASGAGATSS